MDTAVGIFLLFIGMYILYIAIKHYTSISQCERTIEYRYLPRTLKEEQESPVSMRDLFSKMFQAETTRGPGWDDVETPSRLFPDKTLI